MRQGSSTSPRRPWLERWCGWGFWVALAILLALSWDGAELRPTDLWENRANMAEMGGDFFPPDFKDWKEYAEETLVTVQMALWATFLSVVCAVPLGLLAAGNMAPWWVVQPVRRLLDATRAINEVVFALLFIVAVGPGPFAGVLAMWVHTTGVLGKLFAEAVESIDPMPVEGLRATGARHVDVIHFGVIPQVLSHWVSFSLYRFESNVRSASVLGIVGAGGIGMVLFDLIRSFEYQKSCAVLLIFIVVVSVLDAISSRLRKAVL